MAGFSMAASFPLGCGLAGLDQCAETPAEAKRKLSDKLSYRMAVNRSTEATSIDE